MGIRDENVACPLFHLETAVIPWQKTQERKYEPSLFELKGKKGNSVIFTFKSVLGLGRNLHYSRKPTKSFMAREIVIFSCNSS